MAYTCSFCGMEMSDDEKVCSLCGTKREVEQTTEESKKTAAVQPEEKKINIPIQETVPVVPVKPVIPESKKENKDTGKMKFFCSQCGKEYPEGTRFCSACGGKVEEKNAPEPGVAPVSDGIRRVKKTVRKTICTQCGKEYKDGIRFCSECGGKVETKDVEELSDIGYKTVFEKKNVCTQCGKEFPAGIRFCSECGGKVEMKEIGKEVPVRFKKVKKNVCSQCGKEFPAGVHFCSACGGKVEEKNITEETPIQVREIRKNVCTQCGKEFPDGVNFCSSCGGKIEMTTITEEIPEISPYSQIHEYRTFEPEKALSILSNQVQKEHNPRDISLAYDFSVRLGKIEEAKSYLQMLCDMAESGNTDAILEFLDFGDGHDWVDSYGYHTPNVLGYKTANFHSLLEKSAESGDPEAIECIVNGYKSGDYGYSTDSVKAEYWWKQLHSIRERLAESEDPKAIVWVADNYSCGRYGYSEDPVKAEYWRKKLHPIKERLAESGDPEAIEWVADDSEDPVKAEYWWKKLHSIKENLAESGDPEAIEWVADGYEDETCGYPYDPEKAEYWWKKLHFIKERLAESGDPEAIEWVAHSYNFGFHGYSKDPVNAEAWWKKFHPIKERLAESGDPEAIKWVADGYSFGEYGYEIDQEKAMYWWKKIHPVLQKMAEAGDADVMRELFYHYEHRDDGWQYSMGFEENPEKEKYWRNRWENHIRQFIEAGLPVDCFSDCYSLDLLKFRFQKMPHSSHYAEAVADSLSGVKNYSEAAEYYQEAGCQNKAADCYNCAGVMEHNQQKYTEALAWYRKAMQIDPNDPQAYKNIASAYKNGWGVEKDFGKALEWYQKAADLDSYDAWGLIGCLYRDGGPKLKQDFTKALQAYAKAVKINEESKIRKSGFSECCLGYMYLNGSGVPVNETKAVQWFIKAAHCGDEESKKELEKRGYAKNDDGEWVK